MAKWLRILAWVAGALIVLPIVLVGFVLVAANMDWGRRLVETGLGQVLGGQVVVSGLS